MIFDWGFLVFICCKDLFFVFIYFQLSFLDLNSLFLAFFYFYQTKLFEGVLLSYVSLLSQIVAFSPLFKKHRTLTKLELDIYARAFTTFTL